MTDSPKAHFKHSLLARLLAVSTLTVTLTVGASGWFIYDSLKDRLIETNKESIAQLATASRGVLETLAVGEASGLDRTELQAVAKLKLLGEQAGDNTRDYSESDFVWETDGYLFAYDDEGVAEMHPFLEGQDVKAKNPDVISGLLDTAADTPSGAFYEYEFADPDGNVEDKIAYVYEFEPWGWTVGMAVYEYELYEGVGDVALLVTLGTLAVTLLINAILGFALYRPLRTVNRLVGDLERMADGDLDVWVETSDDRSEIGRLARTVAHLKISLAEMLQAVTGATQEVASSTDGLTFVASETTRAANLMAKRASSIHETVESQTSQMEGVSTSIKDISQTMTDLAHKVTVFSEGVSESTERAHAGKETIHEASEGLNLITDSVQSTEVALNELRTRAQSITQVTSVIADISDRTKMLALNAQIEAARAGEQGRGFAVVATEVGNLALSTRESVAEIRDLIQHVERAMTDVTRLMHETRDNVKTGNARMTGAEASFEAIVDRFASISDTLQDITANVEQVTAQTEEAESGLETLVDDAQGVKRLTAELEDAVDALRTQTTRTEEVSTTLNGATAHLDDSVKAFKQA